MGKTLKNKILIVEDEIIVALDLQSAVESFGYEVTQIATNEKEVILSIKENKPDIVLMDINLDDCSKDGTQIALDIKEEFNLPVIFITAFSDDKTIQKAIKTDPVGYLTKPFKRDELKSTMMLAIYKLENQNKRFNKNKNLTDIGDGYYYDKTNKLLYFNEQKILLTAKESELFRFLFEQRGKIVSFEAIEHHIWDDVVSSSSLRTLLYRLRSKLDHKLIETITTQGCKLNF